MIKQAPFKPTDIGGCQLWLDGADRTTITGNVTSIREKANNVSLSVSGTVTATTIGSQSSLSFGGSGYLFGNVNNILTGTSFVVFRTTAANNGYSPFFTWRDNAGQINFPAFGYVPGGNLIGPYTTFVGVGTLTTSVSIGNSYLTSYSWSGTTTNVGFNGATPTSGTQPAFASSETLLWIAYDNGAYTTVNIGEILLYNSVLAAPQRQQVESYLAQKWGLREQLPQGHPGTRGIVYPSQAIPTAIYWRYPTPFVPTQIQSGTCQLWLDGSDSSTITGTTAVSAWTDKSGNGNNTTIFGTPNSTFGTINNVKAMWFNGSSGTYGLFSNTGATVSGFVVGTMNSATSTYGRMIALGNNPGNDDSGTLQCPFLLRQVANQAFCTRRFQTDRTYSSYTYDAPFLASIIYDGTNGNLYVNGSTIVQFGSTGNFGYSNYSVGCGIYSIANNTIDTWTGFVGEVILYRSALTTPQQQQVEGYLAWKWGLQANLPANHPYKNTSPDITNPGGISRPANVLPVPPITLYASTKAPAIMATALSYLPLATNSTDIGSTPKTATTNGTVTYMTVAGKQTAYFSNSLSNYLSLPYTAQTQVTLCFWLYVIDTGNYTAVSINDGASGMSVQVDINVGTNITTIYTAMPNQWANQPTANYGGPGQWVHFAITLNYSTFFEQLYINGTSVATATGSGSPSYTQSQIWLGRSGDNYRAYYGYIRQFCTFPSILTQAQIQSIITFTT